MFSPSGFYLDISARHNLHINSSRDQRVSILAANISGGNKRPVVLTPGVPGSKPLGGSKIDPKIFIFPRLIKWVPGSECLVVKSKWTSDSGSATLRQLNSINKKRGHNVFQMFAICLFAEFPKYFINTKLRNSSWLSVGNVTLNSSKEGPFSSLMYVVCICKFGWIVDMKSIWQRWWFVKSFFP